MLHASMLLGLLGLAVPVIIHLIQRQRLRPQLLATLRFLDREDLANAFAPVPRDKLQLLLRCLLLGLFVLLMSRLVLPSAEPGPRTLVVILDQSMSMRRLVGEKQSLFERCQRQALELIDSLRADDRLSLRLVHDEVATATGFDLDKQAAAELVKQAAVTDHGGAAVGSAIASAVDQLRSRRAVNAAVIVFSDHQQSNFSSYLAETPQAATLRDSLRSGDARVLLVDEPVKDGANLSLVDASFSPERTFIGSSSRLTAVVRNDSDDTQTAALVVKDGDATGEQRAVSLASGETLRLDLVQRFESPLDTVCRVELPEDTQPGDNQFFVSMRMRDRRQVLLVAASDAEDEPQDTSVRFRGLDLLTYAMNPGEALGRGAGTNVTVKRVTPQSFQRVSLPLYSLVVLYGVTDLPEQSRKDLRAFLAAGGGVWLIVDPEVSPARFNESFGDLLAGAAVGQLAAAEQARSIDRSETSIAHSLLVPLLRDEWGSTSDLFFHRYLKLESPGTGRTLLRTTSGDPLATLVSVERGRLLLQLFAFDLESSTLPRGSAFVPLVQQVVATLGEREARFRPDNARVGDVVRLKVPEFRNLQGELHVAGPESRSLPLSGADRDEARLADLHLAGDYRLTHAARPQGRERRVAVNAVSGEASLARLSDNDVVQLFGEERALRLPFAEIAGQFSPRKEILPWLALAVLVALIVEALAGAWQSRVKRKRVREIAPRPQPLSPEYRGEGSQNLSGSSAQLRSYNHRSQHNGQYHGQHHVSHSARNDRRNTFQNYDRRSYRDHFHPSRRNESQQFFRTSHHSQIPAPLAPVIRGEGLGVRGLFGAKP